jgi:hypothetical protein
MRFCLAILILAVSWPTMAAAQENSKDAVYALILRNSLVFDASIQDLTDRQWNYRAPDEKHNIGALAEHAAISANDLQTMVQKAVDAGPQPELAGTLTGQLEVVREIMLNLEQPPDNFRPAGRLVTKADIQEYFPQVRNKALALLDATSNPEIYVASHPSRRIRQLTATQWFYYIGYLIQAHTEHIERIKATPGFPKG